MTTWDKYPGTTWWVEKPTPSSCHLTSTHVPWHVYTPLPHNKYINPVSSLKETKSVKWFCGEFYSVYTDLTNFPLGKTIYCGKFSLTFTVFLMDSKLSKRIQSQNSFGSIFSECHRWVQRLWPAVSGAGGSQVGGVLPSNSVGSQCYMNECDSAHLSPGTWEVAAEGSEVPGQVDEMAHLGQALWPEFHLQGPHSRSKELHISHSCPLASTCALL